MKKQGSILIEVIASIAIITIMITISMNVYIQNIYYLKQRRLEEDINLAIYNLSNEIKYNTSKKEIRKLVDKNNEINLKYDKNFNRELMENHLANLSYGDDIKIKFKDEDNIKINIEIKAEVNQDKNNINIKYLFTKSWWMDEIQ